MKGNNRRRARSYSNLSSGSANEKLSHKEALMKKFDVITIKQANNICFAELDIVKEAIGESTRAVDENAPPKGLNNMGNTCFLNSTLQCLLHTIPLRNYLLSKIHSTKCKVNGACPFCTLEKFMHEYEFANRKVVTPTNVVNTVKKFWKEYRFGRQEDAHEFLVMFLQGILRASFGNSPKLSKKYEYFTMVYRIFAGKLRSQIKCLTCSKTSDSYEPFLALSLDVTKGSTFEEWIRHFCAPETLEGDNKYQCGGCNTLTRARKRMTVYRPPRILIIHFLRFTMTGRKIGKHIKFPKWFNLRVFVSENVDRKLPKDQQNNHIYSLYGVIVHAGKGSKAGHYYSFVKKNEKWYLCNDERITEVKDVEQVMKQNAYMLIYKYKVPHEKKKTKSKAAKVQETEDVGLMRTKSLTAEIKESHENKLGNLMPLSGFFDGKEDVNSEEEEEKLIKKEEFSTEQQEQFDKLDYILGNFEDADLSDIKNMDFMRSLSIVTLKDEIRTPELKSFLSNKLAQQILKTKKENQALQNVPELSTKVPSENGIKTPRTPTRKRKRSINGEMGKEDETVHENGNSTPKRKKRDKKEEMKNVENTQGNQGDIDKQETPTGKKGRKKNRKRSNKKNKNNSGANGNTGATNRKFDNLVKKLLK